jgi:hypothetical protein
MKRKPFVARAIDLGLSDDGKTYRCRIITKNKTVISKAPKLDKDVAIVANISASEVRLAHDVATLGSLGANVASLQYYSDENCEALFGVRIETLLPDTTDAPC